MSGIKIFGKPLFRI